MSASLRILDDGHVLLSGKLDFSSVPQVWPQLASRIERGGLLRVSLREVESSNSAALGMLLEALEHARRQKTDLAFSELPEGLTHLAHLSNAGELLGV